MSVSEIAVLKEQQRALEQQLVDYDHGRIAGNRESIQNEIIALANRIAEMEFDEEQAAKKAQREQQHAQRAEEVTAEITTAIEEFDIGGMSMRDFCVNEQAYQALRIFFQQTIQTQADKLLGEIKQVREESAQVITELRKDNDRLNKENEEQAETIGKLRNELLAKNEEAADNAQKRDAAVAQLAEANNEIERLKGHVQDLQTQLAIGARGAAKVVGDNISGSMADAIKAFKESLPAIYDVQALDAKRSRFSAKLADTDEPIEFGYLEKGKYREVSAEQAESFRTEYLAKAEEEAKRNHEDSAQPLVLEEQPVTVPAFQGEEATADGLASDNASVEMAGEEVTPEAFQRALERISALELAVFTKADVA